METNPIYVPVLKGKEGEFSALEVIPQKLKQEIMPLIEIPPVPYDYASKRSTKTFDSHLESFPERFRKCCPASGLYVDLARFAEDKSLTRGFEAILTSLADLYRPPKLVVSRRSSDYWLKSVHHYSGSTSNGICVRLQVKDFQEDVDLDGDVTRLLDRTGKSGSASDLIVDLEDLGSDVSRAVLVARSVLSMIPLKGEWRSIALAAASFPEDLSDVDAASEVVLPRREWDLWRTLQRRPTSLPRPDIVFADYAISSPVSKELDPRTMRMSANIRYTTENEWLVIKGRNVREYGFSQYFELCRALVEHTQYRGSSFSWGDKFIEECALGNAGPGNATTWRKVGVNHHVTLVRDQISKLRLGA